MEKGDGVCVPAPELEPLSSQVLDTWSWRRQWGVMIV
jgi:hypothetical protein